MRFGVHVYPEIAGAASFQRRDSRPHANASTGQTFYAAGNTSLARTSGDSIVFGRSQASSPDIGAEIRRVQTVLTPDLLKGAWREKNRLSGKPMQGYCYVAAEALFHRLGGKNAGWKACILTHATWPEGCAPGETHWFLRHASGQIADPTAAQFEGKRIAYERAVPCGFLTRKPSRRAQIVLNRLEKA